ncbi:MAG TPA: hypothetical protein VFS62_00485 [Chloroflexota bacterium]|jgi:hypothetical protein|nr:hypothetical protein [Chloroflexota bacterium]
MAGETEPVLVLNRVFRGDLGAAQLWFDQAVLDKYRAANGFRVIRTNTAGRVRSPNWSLDFGIAGDADALIHVAAKDLGERLPETEREHWSQHVNGAPLSRNFLLMRIGGGACIDDGELRDWT